MSRVTGKPNSRDRVGSYYHWTGKKEDGAAIDTTNISITTSPTVAPTATVQHAGLTDTSMARATKSWY